MCRKRATFVGKTSWFPFCLFVVLVPLTNHVSAGFGWLQINSLWKANEGWSSLDTYQLCSGDDLAFLNLYLFVYLLSFSDNYQLTAYARQSENRQLPLEAKSRDCLMGSHCIAWPWDYGLLAFACSSISHFYSSLSQIVSKISIKSNLK